jgi:hypothetical protein
MEKAKHKGIITEIPKERPWKNAMGDHGHSPLAGMKIFPTSKTA